MKTTITLIFALLVAPAVFAGDSKPAKLTAAELRVIAHDHAVNQMEIALGKVAQSHAASPAVKAYGAMLIDDHGEADAGLLAFVKRRGQRIPAEAPATPAEKQQVAKTRAEAARLQRLEGEAFDRRFLAAMLDGHESELATIDARIGEVDDPALADMLRARKPVLQHHADHARELQKGDAQAMN